MTAPTTRETADHIGEANEKVTHDDAELAALIQDLRNSRTVWDNARARPKEIETQAADALETLLSEIAALRGERDRLAEELHNEIMICAGKSCDADVAERQRDELRKALGEAQRRLTATGDFFGARLANEALIDQGAE